MYLMSTTTLFLHTIDIIELMAYDSSENPDPSAPTDAKTIDTMTGLDSFSFSIQMINLVLGDGIVIWRAWLIWQHSWRVIVWPLVLLLGTVGTIAAQVVLTATSSGVAKALSSDPGAPRTTTAKLYIASVVLTLCTNGVVTCLIAYRAWIHYRSSQAIRTRIGSDRVLAVLLLLVESGVLYCVLWITLIALWPFAASEPPVFYVILYLLPQLTGIYPTVIIVICALKRSFADTALSVPDNETHIVFALGTSISLQSAQTKGA
ncbi:hypothetical protein FA95DRAFT_1602866 [Auriscalpium vulgare]|uniref:Uncharacterized protein n=1 Tax=Auriscalpium vulgare TaxID=40419 RepID=A0ACB8S528_9AGAM|nr:hypothetical protein FA95DRAFT_1602866 [Auriscalpium vulgare]